MPERSERFFLTHAQTVLLAGISTIDKAIFFRYYIYNNDTSQFTLRLYE